MRLKRYHLMLVMRAAYVVSVVLAQQRFFTSPVYVPHSAQQFLTGSPYGKGFAASHQGPLKETRDVRGLAPTSWAGQCVGFAIAAAAITKRASRTVGKIDNRSNQMNPNNDAYWAARGQTKPTKEDFDRRSNQMNPNNDAYWAARGQTKPRGGKGKGGKRKGR